MPISTPFSHYGAEDLGVSGGSSSIDSLGRRVASIRNCFSTGGARSNTKREEPIDHQTIIEAAKKLNRMMAKMITNAKYFNGRRAGIVWGVMYGSASSVSVIIGLPRSRWTEKLQGNVILLDTINRSALALVSALRKKATLTRFSSCYKVSDIGFPESSACASSYNSYTLFRTYPFL